MKLLLGPWLVVLASSVARLSEAFAYAPNFITKIIEEQTGIEPKGLVLTTPATDGGDGSALEAATASAASPTATLTQVRTRFPPEPNGYLHLGVSLSCYYLGVTFDDALADCFRSLSSSINHHLTACQGRLIQLCRCSHV